MSTDYAMDELEDAGMGRGAFVEALDIGELAGTIRTTARRKRQPSWELVPQRVVEPRFEVNAEVFLADAFREAIAEVTKRRREKAIGLEARFFGLVREWQSRISWTSSLTEVVLDDAYQQIIGMGQPATTWILEELEREPAQWFWALHAISGEDPAEGLEDFEAAKQAWLDWGRARGHIA